MVEHYRVQYIQYRQIIGFKIDRRAVTQNLPNEE